jgi:exonuclease SbcC
MEQNQVQIDKAEKALILSSEENNIIQRENELASVRVQMQENELLLTNTKKQLEISKELFDAETSEEAEAKRMSISINLDKVRGYESKVKDIVTIEKTIEDLNKSLELNKIKSVENQKGQEKTQSSIIQCKKDMDESKDAELNLEKMTGKLTNESNYNENLTELISKLETIEKLKEEFSQSVTKKQKQEAKLITAETEYKKCKINFFTNQAALIAKELEENVPCPVCGSVDHPNLAVESSESVSEEDLEMQEKLWEDVKAELVRIGNNHGILQERLTNGISSFDMQLKTVSNEIAIEIEQKSDEDKRLRLKQEKATSKGKVDECMTRISSLKESVKRYQVLRVTLEQLGEEQEKLGIEGKQLDRTISEINNDLAVKKAHLQHVFDEVPENLRTLESLTAAISELVARLDKAHENLRKIKEEYYRTNEKSVELTSNREQYSKTIANAEKLIRSLREAFEEHVAKARFTSLEDYHESKFPEEKIIQLKKEQEEYRLACETLKNKLAELTKLTKDKKTMDLDYFDTMINDLRKKRDELISVSGRLTSRIDDNRLTINTIIRINNQIGTKVEKYKVIGQLANISNGKNKAMITFERYVLAAFLEDILKAANIRLKQMTQSRYTLHRTDELSRKNKQSGLELEVFDTYTGKSRHVKTLSGGEGFKASLSMALGLSDVVQSYAGGVRLDTMFIDEGFGSLDQESLDSAINCLIDIQKSGRLVGIISHVQELKERIDTRLEIVTSNVGSESRFVIG